MEIKIYEYLQDILTPSGKRGNVSYISIAAMFNISPLAVCNIFAHLVSSEKISANLSTYGCYVILK